ncbi:unnamed protein product [Symbiodinium natans]|uniref:Uncharacterized protein n=1 Tax=Symbiodinium natans TaxID=878477 RepID=A0A812LYD6_9DINO|nr:unnamed protein product [Symbiodinium natans]
MWLNERTGVLHLDHEGETLCGSTAAGLKRVLTTGVEHKHCQKCAKRSSAQQEVQAPAAEEPEDPVEDGSMSILDVGVDMTSMSPGLDSLAGLELPWVASEPPQYIVNRESLNLKMIHEGLARAATRQTLLFDQLVSLARTCTDVKATTGIGRREYLTWSGAAPPGYEGKQCSGATPEHPVKRARKAEMFENLGVAFMHPVTRSLARHGVAICSIRLTTTARLGVLRAICTALLDRQAPQLSELCVNFERHVAATAQDFGMGKDECASLFADVLQGTCPVQWLDKHGVKAATGSALEFLELIRLELSEIRCAAYASTSSSVSEWLEKHSSAPAVHALLFLQDKVEKKIFSACFSALRVQVSAGESGVFDLHCAREDAQDLVGVLNREFLRHLAKLDTESFYKGKAFDLLPLHDPWQLAAKAWPHLDWELPAVMPWRELAELRQSCRDLVKAGKTAEHKAVFSEYVHSCLSQTCYVDPDDHLSCCEVFDSQTGAWAKVPEKVFAETVLRALKSLALPGARCQKPLEDIRFARSLTVGIFTLISKQKPMVKLDEANQHQLLFAGGMIWDFSKNESYKAQPHHRLATSTRCPLAPWKPSRETKIFRWIIEWLIQARKDKEFAKRGLEGSDLGRAIIEEFEWLAKDGCVVLQEQRSLLGTWTRVLFMDRNYTMTAAPFHLVQAANNLYGASGAGKDAMVSLLYRMLGGYAVTLTGDMLVSGANVSGLEEACRNKRMVVGSELRCQKDPRTGFLKQLLEREGLPVAGKVARQGLQNWSSQCSFWLTSNHLLPFWKDDALSLKVNLWTFDQVFDADPVGYQEQATDFMTRIKQGEFHGQVQWLIFGLSDSLTQVANLGNRILPRPQDMNDAIDQLIQETNQRPKRLRDFIRDHCVLSSRGDGTGVVMFKRVAASYIGCLSEEVTPVMARLGLRGQSRGACATSDNRGLVVMLKRADGSETALRLRPGTLERFSSSIPSALAEVLDGNEAAVPDPLAQKLDQLWVDDDTQTALPSESAAQDLAIEKLRKAFGDSKDA